MDENQVMFERLLSEFTGAAPDGVEVPMALAKQLCVELSPPADAPDTAARTAALKVIRTAVIAVLPAGREIEPVMVKISELIWPTANGASNAAAFVEETC
jgi:hypothetical protein